MHIHQTDRVQDMKDALEECEGAIRKYIGYVRANEAGTLSYNSWQEKDDPTRFVHFIVFEDEDTRDYHANSSAIRHFTEVLYPRLVDPVTFTQSDEFASNL